MIFIRHYTFSEAELSLIRQHRGAANRLGFAVQLSCMRYPGIILGTGIDLPPALLEYVAGQIGIECDALERVCTAGSDTP
jgi:TnpA family transposase